MPDVTVNSHKLHYEEVGTGEPLLFLYHLCTRNARELVKTVADHADGFRIIIPDARSMGESAHVPDVTPEDWVADVGGLLDALSLDSAHIMAETLGSRVALKFAVENPQRVKTLILDAAIAVSEPAGDQWRRDFLNNPPANRIEGFKATHGDDWQAVINLFIDVHDRPTFNAYFNGYELAKQVKMPALIVHGDTNSSPVYPLEHSEELHRLIPDSWLAVYPNTGGDVRVPHPVEFWNLIRTFVQEKG
jgi:pimeloyl-ACP methyl ester carboxylesterase